jgi:Arc/MetJ family transcription regulator
MINLCLTSKDFRLRTTLALDDDLLAEAQKLTGVKERAPLIHEALKALIARESAKRLAMLGGRDPAAKAPPRLTVDNL